jgi:hypothetical protein
MICVGGWSEAHPRSVLTYIYYSEHLIQKKFDPERLEFRGGDSFSKYHPPITSSAAHSLNKFTQGLVHDLVKHPLVPMKFGPLSGSRAKIRNGPHPLTERFRQ